MAKNKRRTKKEIKKEIPTKEIILLGIFIILVGGLSYYINMRNDMVSEPKFKKVLVIGIDGMDPKITNKLFSEGKLPNFKKLSETGTFINLNTTPPPHSPVAWTTIATGVNPGKHNIFDFIRRDPKTHMPMLSLAKSVSGIAGTDYKPYVRSPQFWELTTQAGVSTTVIRWPVSFPPEKVKGNLLSGLGVPDIKGLLSGYTFYTTEPVKGEKVVQVNQRGDVIDTVVSGPRTRKGGDIVSITVPMHIRIIDENSVKITLQDKSYSVEKGVWSDWMRAKFHVGFLNDAYGTFKAYLVSTNPFQMYVTTIQIDPENPVVSISHPQSYSSDLAGDIGLYYTLGMPEETDGFIDGRFSSEAMISQIQDIESERDNMFWKEFDNFKQSDSGILAFVYDSSDRIQHVFWEQKILQGDDLVLNPAVVDYFVEKDAFIGEVIDQLDNETLLLVVSDHGFTSFERSVCLNRWLADTGFLTLTKKLAPGEEGGLFKFVDWSKTKAYAVGFNSIFINLKGRESKGIVENREEVMNEIISKLEDLVDEKTGKKVVYKVYKREDIYSGDYIEEGPDLVVGYYPGFRTGWQTAVGGFAQKSIMDNEKVWDGDHLVDPSFVPGVLFSNIKLDHASASQVDIAPTILDAAGVRVPKSMDGGSLLE